MTDEPSNLRLMTADIVSAYVGSRNHVQAAELPNLIQAVHSALSGLSGAPEPEAAKAEPAVPIRKAVTPDAITCLTCGKRFKALKRHIRVDHDQTPAEYRAQWGLPATFPMVAPNYASARSALARAMGLGQGGRHPQPPRRPAPGGGRGRGRPAQAPGTPAEGGVGEGRAAARARSDPSLAALAPCGRSLHHRRGSYPGG